MSQKTEQEDHKQGASGAIARNAFHLVLGQIGTTALAVLLAAVLGRSLGAADFGLYYLITSTSTFAYVLVEWGQGGYVIAVVARSHARAGELLGSALALRVLGALVSALGAGAVLYALGYGGRAAWLSGLFIVTSLPFSLSQAYSMIFKGLERMEFDSMVSVANKVLVLAATAAAFALSGGLLGATLAQGIAGVAALALAAVLLRRILAPPLHASVDRAKELLAGGTPIVAMALAASAQAYLDVLLLSKLAPAESVGWYGAARNIFGTMAAASFILGSAAYPRLSRAAGDLPRFRLELETALRPLLGMAALAGVGSYLFADVVVGIVFGAAKFAPAGLIIKAFALGQALLFIDVLFANAIVAAGAPKRLAVAKAFTVLITVGLEFLLIPLLQQRLGNGGLGVVAACTGSELIMFLLASWLLPKGTLHLAMLADAGRALLASAGTLLLFEVMPHLPWAIGLPLCVLVFAGLALVVGLVRRSEVEALIALARRRWAA